MSVGFWFVYATTQMLRQLQVANQLLVFDKQHLLMDTNSILCK